MNKIDLPTNFYYGEQIKRYLTQFGQVFASMQVSTGKNDYNSESKLISIPVIYGSPDKVVAAIKSEHTQNKPVRVPLFSMKLENITLMLDRKSGTNTEHRRTIFPVGGDIKKDLKTMYRLKPLPYNLTVSVSAYASNTNQMFQIVEQVLMLFDPMLQFQRSDSLYDWTKIVDAELQSIAIDDNRSADTDGRILIYTFTFDLRILFSAPANVKDNVVQKIRMRIEAVSSSTDLKEHVADVTRPEPEYVEIYNLDNEDIPQN